MPKKNPSTLVIKKVTLGSMKVLAKYGLTKIDNNLALGQALVNVCVDEQSLREICDAIFEGVIYENKEIESIDLEEVAAGIGSFLQRLLNPTRA